MSEKPPAKLNTAQLGLLQARDDRVAHLKQRLSMTLDPRVAMLLQREIVTVIHTYNEWIAREADPEPEE